MQETLKIVKIKVVNIVQTEKIAYEVSVFTLLLQY